MFWGAVGLVQFRVRVLGQSGRSRQAAQDVHGVQTPSRNKGNVLTIFKTIFSMGHGRTYNSTGGAQVAQRWERSPVTIMVPVSIPGLGIICALSLPVSSLCKNQLKFELELLAPSYLRRYKIKELNLKQRKLTKTVEAVPEKVRRTYLVGRTRTGRATVLIRRTHIFNHGVIV